MFLGLGPEGSRSPCKCYGNTTEPIIVIAPCLSVFSLGHRWIVTTTSLIKRNYSAFTDIAGGTGKTIQKHADEHPPDFRHGMSKRIPLRLSLPAALTMASPDPKPCFYCAGFLNRQLQQQHPLRFLLKDLLAPEHDRRVSLREKCKDLITPGNRRCTE